MYCSLQLDKTILHDLAGPTGRIACAAELLRYHSPSSSTQPNELLDVIIDSANRLRVVVGGLEQYARVLNSPDEFRLCQGEHLLTAAVSSQSHSIAAHQAAITSSQLPEVYCDPTQLIHLLSGLIENAIKFCPGRIPEVHVSANTDAAEWVISVQDNGIGIEPEFAPNVFGFLRRGHGDAYPGAGIGLATASQIVRRHGGRIWFESQPGVGTRFSFSLSRNGPSGPTLNER